MLIRCVIVLLFLPALFECLNICGDWTQYKDIKCIKVLRQTGTEEEAMRECSRLDADSTLVSIHSREEQEFLNNLLLDYSHVSIFAWIGLKYQNQSFNWIDGTKNNYSNWAKDAIKDGSEPCVQMSLASANLGKWLDENCKRTGLFVCQKRQVFTLNTLREAVEAIEKKVEHGTIPIGFLYTQLPRQSAPQMLWPSMNWTDVTEEYAGLFFRAEGAGSETFGQIQQANQSWISNKRINAKKYSPGYDYYTTQPPVYETEEPGNWDKNILDTYGYIPFDSFYTTKGEVRPKNTAIRIWKRDA